MRPAGAAETLGAASCGLEDRRVPLSAPGNPKPCRCLHQFWRKLPQSACGRSRQKGSATVWTIAMMAVIWFAAVAVVDVGVARAARLRAQTAADLGALAAATRALTVPEDACARAHAVTIANRSRVDRCSVAGGITEVSVSLRFTLPFFGSRTATAVARAGPVGTRE
jgi:secretion/DNA translocation related TadE-like protein